VQDGDVGGQVGRDRGDRRFVADEDQLVEVVCRGVGERAVDDLYRAVVAAHRVDREPDAPSLSGRRGHDVRTRFLRPTA
jgi:hypothetical protein